MKTLLFVKGYKKNNNRFPDGAVLVKDVRSAKSTSMTTGPNVLSADKEVLWFVMIKDDKNRFPDNPNWGDGWGWALFYAKDPSKNVSTDFKKDCIPCHIPTRQTDWVYIQGYPSLEGTKISLWLLPETMFSTHWFCQFNM